MEVEAPGQEVVVEGQEGESAKATGANIWNPNCLSEI